MNRVEVKTKNATHVGLLMPQEDDKVILKLDSGYNVGIDKSKIVDIKTIEKFEPREHQSLPLKQKSLPKVTILHTGGTIASKVDYDTGAVIARFSPSEILREYPAISEIAAIDSRLVSNMWSGDMRFAHYNVLVREIQKELKKNVKGIIITHGTDTLGYTAAALSFALQGIKLPVVLIGAQRSSDRASSDAALNLLSAARFIVTSGYNGVAVCMHETTNDTSCTILPGTNVKKFHSSRRDAFVAVNSSPLARVHSSGKVEKLREYPAPVKGKIRYFREDLKVGIARVHPNFYASELKCYSSFDGLVIEGTGLGHAPVDVVDDFTKEHLKIFKAISSLAKKIPVCLTTQSVYGHVNLNVYSYGRKLRDANVLGDMTAMITETAFIKLAFLLSNYPLGKVGSLYSQDIAGEINNRIVP